LFGTQHPYGMSFTGTGDKASVSRITRDELVDFHRRWFRPEKARFVVVSDRPLSEIASALEAQFGSWRGQGMAGAKKMDVAPAAANPRIVLIDRPQSLIFAGQVLKAKGADDLDVAVVSNEAIGATFLSRINMDLRETKGWSYGVRGYFSRLAGDVPYFISAPVQADRTGDSIKALQDNFKGFLTTNGMTDEEFARVIEGNVRELPGSFESAGDVLTGIERNLQLNRADNYYSTLATKYRGFSKDQLNNAMRSLIKPDQFLWVVVGDAKKVKPQLEKLGLPLEQMALPTGK
jgi:zinc protease